MILALLLTASVWLFDVIESTEHPKKHTDKLLYTSFYGLIVVNVNVG